MRMNKEKILKLIYNLCKYIIGTVDDIDSQFHWWYAKLFLRVHNYLLLYETVAPGVWSGKLKLQWFEYGIKKEIIDTRITGKNSIW